MGLFLNIFGSAALIGAGVAVLLAVLREGGIIGDKTPQIKNVEYSFCGIKTAACVFFAALLSRWLVFFICYLLTNDTESFGEFIYSVFHKAGDTPHYLYLAENGYQSSGEKENLIVFYPLYPLLMKLVNFAVHSYFVSGIVVSDLCFGFASCFLFELLRLEFGRTEKAIFGVLALFAAPFGLFYGVIYTESLFLLTTLAALFFLRRKKYAVAAIAGFLACLSKTQGVILFVCALYLLVRDILIEKKANIKLIITTAVIPLGFVGYLLLNKIFFGEWFKYVEFQAAAPWYNTAHWFGKTLSQSWSMAHDYPGLANILYYPQLIFFFVGVGALFYGLYKKVENIYLIYGGIYIFTCYTHGWLISGSRYMCACIPLFIIFASCDNRIVKSAILALCAVLYFILTKMWVLGYAIM